MIHRTITLLPPDAAEASFEGYLSDFIQIFDKS